MSGRICEEQEITLLFLMASGHLARVCSAEGLSAPGDPRLAWCQSCQGYQRATWENSHSGESPDQPRCQCATFSSCPTTSGQSQWVTAAGAEGPGLAGWSSGHPMTCGSGNMKPPHGAGLEPQPVWPGPSLKGAAPTKVPAPQPPLPVSPAAHSAQA